MKLLGAFVLIMAMCVGTSVILIKKDETIDNLKVKCDNYHHLYDSLLHFDTDISNHVRKDFGIDTSKKVMYYQFNFKNKY